MAENLYFSKQEFPMRLAELASTRCPRKVKYKIGACIVDDNFRVIGYGFNGFTHVTVPGVTSAVFENHQNFDDFICCAAPNAIYHSMSSTEKANMYITSYPCVDCAKAIVQAGIKKVYYLEIEENEYNNKIYHIGNSKDTSKAILTIGLGTEPLNFVDFMKKVNPSYEFTSLTREGDLNLR